MVIIRGLGLLFTYFWGLGSPELNSHTSHGRGSRCGNVFAGPEARPRKVDGAVAVGHWYSFEGEVFFLATLVKECTMGILLGDYAGLL